MLPDASIPNDPLGLDDVDRQIRINDLNGQLEELGVEAMGVEPGCDPAIHEQFLRSVVEYEKTPLSTTFDVLQNDGIELPSPESLDNAAINAKLWEIFRALAARSTFFYHTNHLSDRQLYERLWSDLFREPMTIMPANSGWVFHFDLIGSGSDEDIQIGLRYYDSEEQRQHWARDFPADVIPPHEDPPYDRDRHLPRAPDPPMLPDDFYDDPESDPR
jgi:hypothetical protein